MWTNVHNMELPDSGVTLTALRETITQYGTLADEVFGRRDTDTDQATVERLAHGCSFHSWALAALLGWLAHRHSEITHHAATLVDSIGCNGGHIRYCSEVAPLVGGKADGAIAILAGVVGDVTRHVDPDGRTSATITVHNLLDSGHPRARRRVRQLRRPARRRRTRRDRRHRHPRCRHPGTRRTITAG
jgi:hypothetical protein